MKPPSENPETAVISARLPKDLKKRVEAFCRENKMTIKEFIADAIIDKLKLAHKERRKRSRL